MRFVTDLLCTAREVVRRMWHRWYIVLAAVIAALAAVTTWIATSKPVYTSTMVVTQAERSRPGLADTLNAAQSVGLLGLALGGGASSKLDQYLVLLESDTIAELLLTKYHYDRVLFASRIDPRTGKWRSSYGRGVKTWLYGVIGVSLPDSPTVADVRDALDEMLIFGSTPTQSTATITCRSEEPALCPQLMLLVHRESEAALNRIALDQAKNELNYFTKILPTISQIELRQAIVDVLADVQKQVAMSTLGEPIAAVILDPPVVPSMPSWPQPILLIALASLLGLCIGGSIAWSTSDAHKDWKALTNRAAMIQTLSPGE